MIHLGSCSLIIERFEINSEFEFKWTWLSYIFLASNFGDEIILRGGEYNNPHISTLYLNCISWDLVAIFQATYLSWESGPDSKVDRKR